MIRRSIAKSALFFSLILSGCAYVNDYQATSQTAVNEKVTIVTNSQKLPPFNKIWVNAPVNLQIITRSKPEYALQTLGKEITLGNLAVTVDQQTLIVRYPNYVPDSQGKNIIKIEMGALKELHYAGAGTASGTDILGDHLVIEVGDRANVHLTGKNIDLRRLVATTSGDILIEGIKTPDLDVIAKNTRNLTLNGNSEIGLRHLIYTGSGKVKIVWVNGDNVIVKSKGRGQLFLAGTAHLLNAELDNAVYLDAKYLRAKKGFINTTDAARADVYVMDSLNAFATGTSNIYHYTMPRLLNQYMREKGSVLLMNDKAPVCPTAICEPVPATP